MANWNPYYGIPNRNDFGYEEQNSNSQMYYNGQYSYNSVPVQENYYYNPTDYVQNFGTVLTLQEVDNTQLNYYADYNKEISEPSCSNVPDDNTIKQSKLTATAAEFKPGTSTDMQVSSQTFYRNPDEKYSSKGAIRKTDKHQRVDKKPDESSSNVQEKYLYNNHKGYNKNNTNFDKKKGMNKNDRYNKRYEENTYRNDNYGNNVTCYSSSFKAKYNRYDNNKGYNRDYDRKSDRNSSPTTYNQEPKNYRANRYETNYQEPRNNYRANRYDVKVENWRTSVKEDIKNAEKKFDEFVKPIRETQKPFKMHKYDISQRDRLIEQVNRGSLECLVCCELVRQAEKIWNCQKCYHIFHLKCITKWARTSKDDKGWRCPACQHVSTDIPLSYYCYCGKMIDPSYINSSTAHSCGEMCGKIGTTMNCMHSCTLSCHPGPCPKCEASVIRNCNCGATKQTVQCSNEAVLICSDICKKKLNCGYHTCTKKCHQDDCETCCEVIEQECFCSKCKREIPCSSDQIGIKNYSCENICGKILSCGNHNCTQPCHPGSCPTCVRSPDEINTCPCQKTNLEIERTSCLDPIPCCDKVCGKRYLCGQPSNPHFCKSKCHENECSICPLVSFVRCRCGHMSCEIPCSELTTRADDARCEKKCPKKRSCGKHKCNQRCCIDLDHICLLLCNRMLSCGMHRCDKTCHNGHCPPCQRISFDELTCECGAMVIYPPIPCGTKRPSCKQPCNREHSCSHETLHTCHTQPECPPCTVLTTKWCHGKHEKRTTLPCHQKYFSCGLPCGKDLSCGKHKCRLSCHAGDCIKPGQKCLQSCSVVREMCGHPCGLPCHEPPCQESQCKEMVKVTCQCGLRSSSSICLDMASEYQRIATSMLASKMADVQRGMTVEIGEIMNPAVRKQAQKSLECNDECRLVERNRRLAIGLQIRNPDLGSKLTPRYSDFIRQWAKKDPRFCQMVHEKLTELVQLAKQSKQKSRSYSFESMNRDKRHFVHEYCEHFGCESAAYDKEPNRNVVATAQRDKAWLPSVSVLELLQRENGQRKVPGPILNRPLGSSNINDTVSLKLSSSKQSAPSTSRQVVLEAENIDYFDFNLSKI